MLKARGQRPEHVRCGDCVFFVPDYFSAEDWKGERVRNRGRCQATPPGFESGISPDDGCGMFRTEWPETCGCREKVMDAAGALAVVGNVDAAELLLHTARSLPECS